jgi:hypothetical protein
MLFTVNGGKPIFYKSLAALAAMHLLLVNNTIKCKLESYMRSREQHSLTLVHLHLRDADLSSSSCMPPPDAVSDGAVKERDMPLPCM